MAYRFEKQENGDRDLVIDGFEKGIADSPFKGIGNIRNLNVKYYEGVAYMNYKRQACTISGGTLATPLFATQSPVGLIYISDSNRQIWKQNSVNSSTFTILTGNNASFDIRGLQFWNNYLFTISDEIVEICGDGTGDAGVTSGNWNNTPASVTFTVTIATPAVFTKANHGLSIGDNLRFTTTGALPTGLSTGTNYYIIAGGFTSSTFEVSATAGGSAVNTSGSQSGVHSYTVARGVWPIKSGVTITLTAVPVKGDTSATISSYTDSQNVPRTIWNGPTGYYYLHFTNQVVLALFTQNSSAITWTPALNQDATSVTSILRLARTIATDNNHMSLVAVNTGDFYYANVSDVAAFTLNLNQVFNKNDVETFTYYASILALPPTELAIWLSELRNQLIVAGRKALYPWDFFSPFWVNPVPMDETISKMINILNNIYILAGNKGNIYQSNGYSIMRYRKIPDYISGAVDPAWEWGGIMTHRQRLHFQALAKNGQSGTAILAGIFSLDLDSNVLNMENQNSGGLTPTGITSGGLLIDDNSTAVTYDKYYSTFSATASSIDFNDTTLYSNSEAVIETDIVPVGTFLQNKTYASAEFKLDQPLQTGDSITLYARKSLSDTFTLLGTTTSAVLSDCFQSLSVQQFQWIQFKVTMSCNATATSSSFDRLREIRIR